MKKIGNKKKITAISLILILAVIGAAGVTFAMLKAQSATASNNFSGAIVNVAVDENGIDYESGSNGGYQKITTNAPVAKSVKIKNKDTDVNGKPLATTDTYVRVRLVPIFRDENGGSVAADMSKVQYTFGADTVWKKQETDGETYYFYTKALAPGQETGELITQVSYTAEVPEGTTFELQVLTEGVAAGQKDSLSAWGLTDFNGLKDL